MVAKYQFIKKPSSLANGGVKTGLSNSSCIAKFTENCSTQISGEHYFSKSVLKLINDEKLLVTGWPYNAAREAKLPISGLVVNCLCSRHNSLLSPLDDVAAKLFGALVKFSSSGIVLKPDSYQLFHYWDLERWLIKTLVMAGEAGFLRKDGVLQALDSNLKHEFLKILFEDAQLLLKGAGVYVLFDRGVPTSFSKTLGFNSNSSTLTNQVEGCTIHFCGYKFAFSPRKLSHIENIPVGEDQYRPWRFIMKKGLERNVIDFSAKDGVNQTYEIEISQTI